MFFFGLAGGKGPGLWLYVFPVFEGGRKRFRGFLARGMVARESWLSVSGAGSWIGALPAEGHGPETLVARRRHLLFACCLCYESVLQRSP